MMKYYVVRDDVGNFAKGKNNKIGTFRLGNTPPKLYTLGTARQLQSFYRNIGRELEILEAYVHIYPLK